MLRGRLDYHQKFLSTTDDGDDDILFCDVITHPRKRRRESGK